MIRVERWARVLVLLQLLRLVVGSLFELVPQEAYYLFYARHPALSYFDHPGALAWALALPARLLRRRRSRCGWSPSCSRR